MNVLLTGAGAPGAAGIIKCFRNSGGEKIRIIGSDVNGNAYGKAMVDSFYVVPHAEAPQFVDKILEICRREQVDVVVPIVTRELPVFAANKALFHENNVRVSVMSSDLLNLVNNKYTLLEHLKDNGIRTPDYILCESIDQVENACSQLNFPREQICFKPTVSNGSRGFRILSNSLEQEVDLLFNSKPTSAYLTYPKMMDLLAYRPFPPLLFMEYLPGVEWTVDCLVSRGEAVYCIPRRRDKMNGGISVEATLVQDADIIALASEICAVFGVDGNIGMQFKGDKHGKPQLLEINPRLQGTTVICAAANVNLPYFGVLSALGKPIPNVDVNWNISMSRYWEEIYFDTDGQPFAYDLLGRG